MKYTYDVWARKRWSNDTDQFVVVASVVASNITMANEAGRVALRKMGWSTAEIIKIERGGEVKVVR